MGKTRELRLVDVRAILRIVGELRERADDARLWTSHLLNELSAFLGVTAALAIELNLAGLPHRFDAVGVADLCLGNLEPWEKSRAYFVSAPRAADPLHGPIMRRIGRNFTCRRPEMIGQGEWHRSSTYQELSRPVGIDSWILSSVVQPDRGWRHILYVHRDGGDAEFSDRDGRIVRLIHEELQRLWQEEAAWQQADAKEQLPRRWRQTMELLSAGLSEKQVAFRLGLSRHTVHNYVKALHKRLNVGSRAELVAARMARGARHCPRMAHRGY